MCLRIRESQLKNKSVLVNMVKLLICVILLAICISGEEISYEELSEIDERIVGGKNVTIEEYPWQVSLQYGRTHICGGSLYSKDIVITAAHCVFNKTAEHFKVRVGSTKYYEGGELVNVTTFKIHNEFNFTTYENNIALLRLEHPVTFSRKVKSIKLARRYPTFRTNAVVTGWGSTGGNLLSTSLQAANVKLLPPKDCASSSHSYGNLIKPGMICAYAKEKDLCDGDSGGPLVNRGRLIGVVCWDRGCGHADLVGVYTDVVHYKPWISQTVKEW